MIVERTEYYARPGLAGQVLAIRRRACAVRRNIGLQNGTVFTHRPDSDAEGPDVVWEGEFATSEEHKADLAARAASPAFEAVRKEMTQCLARFKRHFVLRDDAPIQNGMRSVDLRGVPIVPQELTVVSAGRELKGYLYLPPIDGPFPCLLLNHGSTIEKGTLDVARPGTSALLMSWGITSFLLHRHGYGNSPGPAWREEACAEFGTPEYDAQVSARLDRESNDVLAAFEMLKQRHEIRVDHIGVMGSSFGGTNTLLAASKSADFTCAIDFAGAAMNWERTPALRELMKNAARKLRQPIFLIQAENDYSIAPTRELSALLKEIGHPMESKIYPAFGVNPHEGHLLESRGADVWGPDVRRFLERYL
jgi:dienelactone hydrolase